LKFAAITPTAAAKPNHVFALCTLLGFEFAPRIPNLKHRRLYCFGKPSDYPTLELLIAARTRWCTDRPPVVFPFPTRVSVDASGDRHTGRSHPVEHVACHLRLGPLIGQTPGNRGKTTGTVMARSRTPAIK
jgi:hypothetical protein